MNAKTIVCEYPDSDGGASGSVLNFFRARGRKKVRTDPAWGFSPPSLTHYIQSSPRHGIHRKLAMILPLPFGRGEGRGEGSRSVFYPTVSSVCGARRAAEAQRRAFTLIELLVVIAIIAILAALLLP